MIRNRSLWDHQSLIAHLDIEYVNFDFPAEPYLDLERSFELQQPVAQTIEKMLLKYGIKPLHLISGRGHHFVWRISRQSKTLNSISELGPFSQHLKDVYNNPHYPKGESVPFDLGAGFAGLGLIMEYLAHQLKAKVAPHCKLPVELTAVAVGPEERGREIISIDISEYGDPLHTRMIRIPFSPYLKPLIKDIGLHDQIVDQIPFIFMIPLHEMSISQALEVMVDQVKVADLAKRASTKIPNQSKTMANLVTDYQQSAVKKFHEWFYSQEHFRRMENAAEALNRVSEFCCSHNMNLILENMLPHLLFGHTSDLLWIMGAIEQRNLGICLDTGHANLSGDLDTVVYKLSGHLKMVHAADNKGKNDDHLPPGQGYIDWYKLILKLNKTGFHGAFILELSGDEGKSIDVLLEDACHARHFIWDIARKIDLESPL